MKAILVFDINDLTYKGIEEGFINELTLHLRSNGFYEIKDVELKPMPQKEDEFERGIGEYNKWLRIGYNKCIAEILGE